METRIFWRMKCYQPFLQLTQNTYILCLFFLLYKRIFTSTTEMHQILSFASSMTTEFPRMTIIPMFFRSPCLLISIPSSRTRFMKGSYPRRMPSAARLPFNLMWICKENNFISQSKYNALKALPRSIDPTMKVGLNQQSSFSFRNRESSGEIIENLPNLLLSDVVNTSEEKVMHSCNASGLFS